MKKPKKEACYFKIGCEKNDDQVYLEAEGTMEELINLFANAMDMSPEIGKLMRIAIKMQDGTLQDSDMFNLSNN